MWCDLLYGHVVWLGVMWHVWSLGVMWHGVWSRGMRHNTQCRSSARRACHNYSSPERRARSRNMSSMSIPS